MKITNHGANDGALQLREVYEWDDLDKFHWHTFHQRSYIIDGQVNEALLQEGLATGLAKDAIQWAVGAAGEYGLGALTLPAGGAGLAVGPTVETVVDSLFAVESVASSVEAATGFAQSAGGELGEVFTDMWSNVEGLIQGGLDHLGSLYSNIVKIVRAALKVLGAGGKKAMQKASDKVTGVIEKLINKLIDAIVQGIKVVLPDATVSGVVSAALRTALSTLATNAYSIVTTIIDGIGPLKEFLTNPDGAVKFFKGVFDQVVELLKGMAEKIEDISWLKTMALTAVPGVGLSMPAIKALGPSGFNALADKIKEHTPIMLKVIDSVLTVLMPAMFAALAIYQIIAKEDWKTKKSRKKAGLEAGDKRKATPKRKAAPKKKAATSESLMRTPSSSIYVNAEGTSRRRTQMKITKHQLRGMIREEVHRLTEDWDDDEGGSAPEVQVGDDHETGDLVLFVDGDKMSLDDVYKLRDEAEEDSVEYEAYEAGIQAFNDAMYES
ncbi:MAG TPA: hypothetical protein EYG51_08175 [Pseudomonadales bacterium]|nr:hypothetical protein [Pseudomonadales bacterium]